MPMNPLPGLRNPTLLDFEAPCGLLATLSRHISKGIHYFKFLLCSFPNFFLQYRFINTWNGFLYVWFLKYILGFTWFNSIEMVYHMYSFESYSFHSILYFQYYHLCWNTQPYFRCARICLQLELLFLGGTHDFNFIWWYQIISQAFCINLYFHQQ